MKRLFSLTNTGYQWLTRRQICFSPVEGFNRLASEQQQRLQAQILQLRQYVKQNMFNEAQSFYTELKSQWKELAMIAMLEASCRYGKANPLSRTFYDDLLHNDELLSSPGVLDTLMGAMSILKMSKELLTLESFVKAQRPKQLTLFYYCLITMYLRSHKEGKGLELIHQLKEDSTQFDAYLYGAEMACYVTPLNIARFHKVWETMQSARVPANQAVLDVLLLALSKKDCTAELLRVLRELPSTYKFKRRQKNFVIAMKHCVSAFKYVDAINVFKLLESDRIGIPAVCYELGLYCAVRVKDFTFGIRMLQKMFISQKAEPVFATYNFEEATKDMFPEEIFVPGLAVNQAVILQLVHSVRRNNLNSLLDPVLKDITQRHAEAGFLFAEADLNSTAVNSTVPHVVKSNVENRRPSLNASS